MSRMEKLFIITSASIVLWLLIILLLVSLLAG